MKKKICFAAGAVTAVGVVAGGVFLVIKAMNKAWQDGYQTGKDEMTPYKQYFMENCSVSKKEKQKITKEELLGKAE